MTPPPAPGRLHGAAAFLTAALLFLVQPLLAKMALPSLGGSPATWIAAALLFQTLLLLGYLWAHLLVRLPPPLQLALHTVLLLTGFLVLPPAMAGFQQAPALAPLPWSLWLLARAGGLPALALAATAPLVGRWYASSAPGRDPYVLYAAGNGGSLAGLLAYPFVLEPWLPLSRQARLFALLYGLAAGLVLACGWWRLRAPREKSASRPVQSSWRERVRWGGLAFLPVSVQLGAAQYLTTDIAAAPLLWVLPLAVYLVTFVVAFSPGGARFPLRPVDLVLAATALGAFAPVWMGIKLPAWLLIGAHLVLVAAAGLAAHVRLAAARPEPERLTGFYLTVAAGGLAAGAAHALLFPLLFQSVLEYPLVLAAAVLLGLLGRGSLGRRGLILDLLFPLQLAGAVVLLELLSQRGLWSLSRTELAIEGALVALAMLLFLRRPLRFAAGFLLLLVLSQSVLFTGQTTLHQARTFFGVHRVARVQPPPAEVDGRLLQRKPYHLLIHGTTRHGAQYPDPLLRRFATAYYHESGPIGAVFAALEGDVRVRRVGIVGLGTGTLAAYGGPDRYFSFYELDPEVVRIAQDPDLFTYLAEAPGPVDVTVGDGRLALARAHDGEFGLLVLDAFSSDAIPVHLLTREALALYLRKLQPQGLLAFHVSNHYLDLPPVLSALAADLGLTGRVRADAVDSQLELFELKSDSTWVVLARSSADLEAIAAQPGWRPLPAPQPRHLWTDQRSSLLPVLKWRKG